MTVRQSHFLIKGGLDLVAPATAIPPGTAIATQNYEVNVYGGMSRIKGYERFDGQQRPSGADYWTIDFISGSEAVAVDTVITGGTSGATGVVLEVPTAASGSFGGGDATGVLVLGRVQGQFESGEALNKPGPTDIATSDSTAARNGALTDASHSAYTELAIAEARGNIAAVPGSGGVLGVHVMNDGTVIAFRNNSGATQADMWRASTSGWSQIDLGATIAFDTGSTAAPAVGATITGGTSGATAVVTYVHALTSGDWSTNDAVGVLSINSVSGGPFTAGGETITYSGGSISNTASEVDVTLSPGGRYEMINYNFEGFAETIKTWGVDGKNKAFMWDGTAFVQISTGMAVDTPKHLAAHHGHLFLSFDGSLQNSAIRNPFSWSVVLGANEIGTGDVITGLQTERQALVVFNRDRTYILTGTSNLDWALLEHSKSSGAVEYSIQSIGHSKYLDDRGLTELYAVQEFGDFASNVFALQVQPYVLPRISKVSSSTIVREKNQYRLFFSDGDGLFATFDRGQLSGVATVAFDHVVKVTSNGEESNWQIPFDAGTVQISQGDVITGGTSGATAVATSDVVLDSGAWDGSGVGTVEVTRLTGNFVNNDALQVAGTTMATSTAGETILGTGREVIYFGSDNGFVYQMESGKTFDGEGIESSLRLAFNNVGSPEWRKRFRKAVVEIAVAPTATITVLPALDYGDPDVDSPIAEETTLEGGGAFWDSANWDEFSWGGRTVSKLELPIDGSGENLSLLFLADSATDEPFTIQSVTLHYSYRSRIR